MIRDTRRMLAIDVCDVSATKADPPSRAARESLTISVPAGSDPESTMMENPPHRRSSSAARREFLRFAGRTRTGPSSQNSPEMVPSPSIQAARSPVDATVIHADRRIPVAPPCGSHTDSRPRGSPPFGRIPSSRTIPVATGSAVRCVTGVASGKRCWIKDRRRADDDMSLALLHILSRTKPENKKKGIPYLCRTR